MEEDVEEHRRVLRDLVRASGDISVLACQVENFERWDVEPLVDLGAPHVISILERFLRGELSADEVGIWAEALEMRDDVGFVDDAEIGVTTVVCWLANEVVGARPITPEDAREFVAELRIPPAPARHALVASLPPGHPPELDPEMPRWAFLAIGLVLLAVALSFAGYVIHLAVRAYS